MTHPTSETPVVTGSTPTTDATATPAGSRRFWQVGAATLVVGASGYLVLMLAAPALGPARYATFAVFWAVLYFVTGSIFGVQQEVTRSVKAAADPSAQPQSGGARVLLVGGIVGIGAFLVVLATSPLWAGALFGDDATVITLIVLGGTLLYTVFAVTAGSLAGSDRWPAYSWLMIADALVRLALIVAIVVVGAEVVPLAVATAVAMGVWLIAVLWRTPRRALAARGDAPLRPALGRALSSVTATASTALLVTGFAAMLALVVPDAPAAELGVVILVVTLTRAPILMPINAYLGVAVAGFYDHRDRGIRVIVRPVLLVLAVGAFGSVLAALIGPWLLVTLFGAAYQADGLFVGLATAAATLIGVLSLTGSAALAFSRHRAYLLGWVVAAAVAVALLLVPLDLTDRVIIALGVAPLVGVAIHLLALTRGPRTAD